MHDVAIIGSGPAGYTAALYASRALLSTLLLSGLEPGGQLTTTTEVENFPGFPKGILGPRLMLDMKSQVERFGTKIQATQATGVAQAADGKTFEIRDSSGALSQAKSVIIATGASALSLGLASEQKLRGKGVSACATCDGFFFKGKEVVVVGGGDTAMEEAMFLTTFATKVTVIHRRNEFRASAIMLERARKNPKIEFLTNKTIEDVLGETSVTGVRVKDTGSGQTQDITVQGVFLAIGHKPNTEFLRGFVDLDEKGYIQTKFQTGGNPRLMAQTETSVPGIFAAGDCVDPRYRQAIVAAGQGCMAAMDAQKWLEEQGDRKT